jgi:hypothetical protein
VYILQSLHDIKQVAQQELTELSSKLSSKVEWYARFFRPVRFLMKILVKVPFAQKFIQEPPEE